MSEAADNNLAPEHGVIGAELEVEAILKAVPLDVLASRIRRARLRRGFSIRDLAERANINKNSVVRLEKGKLPRANTVVKLCQAMGIHIAVLAREDAREEEIAVVDRVEHHEWMDMANLSRGILGRKELGPKERKALAKQGISAPMVSLASRLKEGVILPTLVELFGPCQGQRVPGEEWVYVLSGSVEITVGDQHFVLNEGDSLGFWCSEDHCYAPAKETTLPVRILSICVHTGGKKTGS